MPIQLNDVIRTTFYSSVSGQRLLNVLHYRVSELVGAPDTIGALESIANELGDETVANQPMEAFQQLTAVNCTWNFVRAQRVYPAPTIYIESPIAVNGLRIPGATLPNIALSISKRTATPGRTGVGRVQIGGMSAEAYVDGKFTNSFMSDVELNAPSFRQTINVTFGGIVLVPVLFHGPNALQPTSDVLVCDGHIEARTMHRRTVGLGI